MAGPCRRRISSTSLAALVGLKLLLFSGIAAAEYTPQQIQQECRACDNNIMTAINTYQSDFGKWNKAVDGAKFHCGRFAKLRTCYTDCLRGTIYTYSSSIKSIFEQFYSGVCDPVCYMAILPYCYATTVGTYDVTKSCSGSDMNQNLKACIQTELFVRQNCTGVCTKGQRKALYFYFNTMFQCTIPYQTANECFTWALFCSEYIFGYDGAAYYNYANQTIIASNRLGCSYFGDSYRDCVEQAIDGDVTIGTKPYSVTYHSPCADYVDQLTFLTEFDYQALVAPFCDNPDQSFNDTCASYTARTTTTTATTTTRPTSSSAAATARVETPAASAGSTTPAAKPMTSASVTSTPARQTTTVASTSDIGGRRTYPATARPASDPGSAAPTTPLAASQLLTTSQKPIVTNNPSYRLTFFLTASGVRIASPGVASALLLFACLAGLWDRFSFY